MKKEEELIAVLQGRIERLEAALKKYTRAHPVAQASEWRTRLKACGSPWGVFVLSTGQKPLASGKYQIEKAPTDPDWDHFIVARLTTRVGRKLSKNAIEKWVSEAEEQSDDIENNE